MSLKSTGTWKSLVNIKKSGFTGLIAPSSGQGSNSWGAWGACEDFGSKNSHSKRELIIKFKLWFGRLSSVAATLADQAKSWIFKHTPVLEKWLKWFAPRFLMCIFFHVRRLCAWANLSKFSPQMQKKNKLCYNTIQDVGLHVSPKSSCNQMHSG